MEENFELLEGYQFNLSDFALFLSVMKDPRAYRCVLSVFMDEPDINSHMRITLGRREQNRMVADIILKVAKR